MVQHKFFTNFKLLVSYKRSFIYVIEPLAKRYLPDESVSYDVVRLILTSYECLKRNGDYSKRTIFMVSIRHDFIRDLGSLTQCQVPITESHSF